MHSLAAMEPLEFIVKHDIPNALARATAAHKGPIDHHWYEARWNRHLQKIAGLIQGGETELYRVIDRLRASREKRNVFTNLEERVWMGERVRMNPVLMSHQRRALINAVLFDACTPDTDTIVKLGSGDGMNLFEFWLTASPRDAGYMAFEIASTGRLTTELLGTLEPRMKVSAHYFDYYAPVYDAVPSGQTHMLVFTSGSIEQIRHLPKAVITGLLDKAEAVVGVHFEPVGWQLPEYDNPAHRKRCLELGYNENLWPLLTELQQDSRIHIDRVVADVFGKIKHPTALIEWHKL
jgi:hypothetical protein